METVVRVLRKWQTCIHLYDLRQHTALVILFLITNVELTRRQQQGHMGRVARRLVPNVRPHALWSGDVHSPVRNHLISQFDMRTVSSGISAVWTQIDSDSLAESDGEECGRSSCSSQGEAMSALLKMMYLIV